MHDITFPKWTEFLNKIKQAKAELENPDTLCVEITFKPRFR